MSASFRPIIVVLAAGKSSRFNGIKMLAKINTEKGSKAMLQSVLNNIEPLEVPTIIATGEYHHLLKENIITGADFYFCSNAHLGMAHTIAQSTKFVHKTFKNISHIMFVLADQVALTTEQYQLLLQQSKRYPSKLHYCQTAAGISAPSVFPTKYWSQLTELEGDKGAKSVIVANLKQSKGIEIENADIDIDQQEQLIQWNEQYEVNHDNAQN